MFLIRIFKFEIEHPKIRNQMDVTCISYKDTGYFSPTVIDYLDDVPELRKFYSYRPTLDGFAQLLQNKNGYCRS